MLYFECFIIMDNEQNLLLVLDPVKGYDEVNLNRL